MNALINRIVLDHVLAEPGVVALIAFGMGAVAHARGYVDSVLLIVLKFVPAETVKAYLDEADAEAKAEVDKEAAAQKP